MDFNQSKEISPANSSPQVQNTMPILPHLHQVNKEFDLCHGKDDEKAGNLNLMQKQEQSLKLFWRQKMLEIDTTSSSISIL
ncbi:hypothetical protein Q3G72_002009 [Acer saccharum]|nr:hypothetical protein Q3G72_002009 [Acer saccharum]